MRKNVILSDSEESIPSHSFDFAQGKSKNILVGNEKGANPVFRDRTRMTRIERIYAEKAISFIKNQ